MRERATWRIWIVLWLLAALQTTLLARWRPLETDVDWILLSVVSVSILLGWPVGALYGLVAGWLTGVAVGDFPGSFAISRFAAGGVLAGFDKFFSLDNPFAAPLGAAAATIVANLTFALMSPASFPVAWWLQRTGSQIVLHALLIVPLHWLLTRFVLPPSKRLFGDDTVHRLG